ncbi:hypothetical protein VB834_09275 [Limnoraphis robusta Tam1]|uniref:Uncharacterized protein n=1 Tax=Limnoraphis robusta CCNP1315 TaxID=3110306 RepID=A0ABU5TXD5_9CYAN|nr:hypothetical protein [Limnoraphis robusta]MEA5500358.1 hypothetical protein [Limnoraphis robusta BA-68 BA1]MEA5519560.1 hypothetical protein [Limnoraphis robusta CCNP1315]MEA5539224.1 hypothetical protein [Limnoraphis robusta Tam1]MEA5545828.1 hypothetical protein [Limnoraphis robusta CCNP1324]
MFKVSEKKDVGMVLTPDWTKTSSKRLTFKGFKSWSDEQHYYVALFNCKATECKQWKNDDNGRGDWININELPSPVLLRFLKTEQTYKGKDGKPDNTIKPSEWDLFFIDRFDELASEFPDGLVEGTLDCTENNLGFANRWKIETNEDKKAILKEAFLDVKPITESVDGLSDYSFDKLANTSFKKSGSSYTPKETTEQVLNARMSFIAKHFSTAIDGTEGETLPLHYYFLAMYKLPSEEFEINQKYLEVLIKIATGGIQ